MLYFPSLKLMYHHIIVLQVQQVCSRVPLILPTANGEAFFVYNVQICFPAQVTIRFVSCYVCTVNKITFKRACTSLIEHFHYHAMPPSNLYYNFFCIPLLFYPVLLCFCHILPICVLLKSTHFSLHFSIRQVTVIFFTHLFS